MKSKFLTNLLLVLLVLFSAACKKMPKELEDPAFNGGANESFVESSLPAVNGGAGGAGGTGVVVPGELWVSPAKPNADQPLTITLNTLEGTPLYNYTGDIYAHIGILEFGTWRCVQAEWTENIDKCKFVKDSSDPNTWNLTLEPTVREYFESGATAVTQIGLVIRSSDSQTKQFEEDLFITVVDDKYKAFEPTAYENKSLPAGFDYGITAEGTSITMVLHDQDKAGSHKDYAFVIGDFNNWTLSNDDKSRMYRDDSKGCWWLTVSGLDPDKEYRFQYHLVEKAKAQGQNDKVVRMSDPFSEKVLDPDNDKWINYSNQIYPAAEMEYPDGGVGTVTCVKINRDNFAWTPFEMKNKDCPVIYEMLLGDFTETHDLAGAKAKIPYLKKLGINAVELMPIQEFDGNESWGYNPNHYFAVDKAYGTSQQYKEFIDECHKNGIAVIIDVVYNHSTGSSPLAKLNWDSSGNKTASNNPYFFPDAKHPFNVFHDINHQNKFMQDLIKRSLIYLVEEYNVDGFRFDLSKGFTWSSSGWDNTDNQRIALIKDYASAIRSVDSDSYIILEHWGTDDEESQYVRADMHPWKKMNKQYCEAAMGHSGEVDKDTGRDQADFEGVHKWLDNTWGATGWVTFMESHDEERMAYKQEKYGHSNVNTHVKRMNNLANNAAMFLTVPGPKMIWQMGELGYNYNKWCTSEGVDKTSTEEYETARKPVKWDYEKDEERAKLLAVYTKLNKLRNDNPDLFGVGVDLAGTNFGGWPLKTVALSYGSKKVWVYANYWGKNQSSQTINIPSGTWTDILTGNTFQGGNHTLQSGQALVLVNSAVVK